MRLGILTSHPIQYQAPWFRALAQRAEVKVFFAHRQSAAEQGKAGFGVAFDWDVDLLAGYEHQFLKNISASPGVNHFAGCDTPEIEGLIHAGAFDAFILNGWYLKSYRQATQACRAAGVPVLVRGDSQLRTPRSLVKRLGMEVKQRWLLRQFDGFLTVGQRNREYLEHFGAPPGKIFFVPHFVDNAYFKAKAEIAREQKTEIRKQWGIAEDAFVVLFCGKFIPKKRPLDLVAAAKLAGGGNPLSKLHLLFVGSGELGAQLRASCQVVYDAEAQNHQLSTLNHQLGARPRATFAGFKNQSELPACYASADVLVLPSESETWGLVVNEAIACGLPAIVSDAIGCGPDLIHESMTGFTFLAGSETALAQRLQQMTTLKMVGHDFRPALADKTKTYSVERAVAGTLEAVQSLRFKL